MDPILFQRVKDLEAKIDAIYQSVESTRRYARWTAIVTIAVIVIPLIGLIFAAPSFLNNYVGSINSLMNY